MHENNTLRQVGGLIARGKVHLEADVRPDGTPVVNVDFERGLHMWIHGAKDALRPEEDEDDAATDTGPDTDAVSEDLPIWTDMARTPLLALPAPAEQPVVAPAPPQAENSTIVTPPAPSSPTPETAAAPAPTGEAEAIEQPAAAPAGAAAAVPPAGGGSGGLLSFAKTALILCAVSGPVCLIAGDIIQKDIRRWVASKLWR